MGKKGGGSQTTQHKTEIPAWISNAAKNNLNLANQITAPHLSYSPTEAIAPFAQNELASHAIIEEFAAAPSHLTREASGLDVMEEIASVEPEATFDREGGLSNQIYTRDPVAKLSAVSLDPGKNTTAPTTVSSVGDVSARKFTDANLQAYLNPYTQNVVDSSLEDLSDTYDRSAIASNLRAAAAGAFGGGRHGIRDAQVADDYLRNVARTTSGLRQQAFNTAAQLINQDNQRALQAEQVNQANRRAIAIANAQYADQARQEQIAQQERDVQRRQTAAMANFNEASRQSSESANFALQHRQIDQADQQMRLRAAEQLAGNSLAQQRYNDQLRLQQAQALSDVGAQQRAQYQAVLDAPLRALQTRQAALGSTPYPTTTTSTTSNSSGKGGGILGQVARGAFNSLSGPIKI